MCERPWKDKANLRVLTGINGAVRDTHPTDLARGDSVGGEKRETKPMPGGTGIMAEEVF